MSIPLAGARLLASDLATIFPTNTDAWIAYTPVWTASTTAPVLGNGSLTGAYMKIGRSVFFRWTLSAGTTTTYGTGNYSISVPPFLITSFTPPIGRVSIIDSSAGARFNRDMQPATTSTFTIVSEAGAAVTNLVPMTWANTDTMSGLGFYEAAS